MERGVDRRDLATDQVQMAQGKSLALACKEAEIAEQSSMRD